MHRIVQYRAEFHEILPCTIPPCALNLSDTPNLLAYMQIRKCHFFYSDIYMHVDKEWGDDVSSHVTG